MIRNKVEYKRFVWEFSNTINQRSNYNQKLVFLCLGTNKIVGDSFGPVVGSVLKRKICNKNIKVIGDLEKSITYEKIENCKKYIENECGRCLVIAIDSAMSNKSDVGKVFVQDRGLKYGESLKKKNELIGNISIKAVVAENTFNNMENFKRLQNVSLNELYQMSEIVCNGIIDVVNKNNIIGKNIYKFNS